MIVEALSAVYGAATTWRRQWYAAPARAKRLSRPVISIGNLRVGGTGKTPVVAYVARMLAASGERPVILSRGYRRQTPSRGVTVVSDHEHVLVDVAHAGDEPLLLARLLPGVPVLVCADRYEAGRVAESTLDATVHLLDDGFQHVRLARQIDLLLVDEHDLDDRVLPAGRLREPLTNAAAAHALIVPGGSADSARKIGERLGVPQVFRTMRRHGAAWTLRDHGTPPAPPSRVFAIAGIARPERFLADLAVAGFDVAGSLLFRDHHPFDQADVARIADASRASGATAVVTTEKDAMRLEPLALPAGLTIAAVPLETVVEPADLFSVWIGNRLALARAT
ncbi:MAG: tetraacyldisaccharide 4'-kinase [Chitinophagaceae bacterium]